MSDSADAGFADDYAAEDDVLREARARAGELGLTPLPPSGGAALRLLAATLDARAVVEVGTGTGVTGVWLLRGMRSDGVLTTVDVEPEQQRAAREAFAAAGVPPNRARVINGQGLEVLPRLTDGGYDLVRCGAGRDELPTYLEEAVRLLRPGGIVVFNDVLHQGRVADPAQRDPVTVALREFVAGVREDDRLIPCLLPAADGMLCAVKRR